ncbi:MAG: hypothetical protein LBR88_07040 [Zoogloeaceae bacterium]|jgi:hypothetical protein|nr:hypothetical protein [Zoogloeaceae bacterium]
MLNDLFERVMMVCGSPGSLTKNHEGTAATLANTGGSPGSPGSLTKVECTERNTETEPFIASNTEEETSANAWRICLQDRVTVACFSRDLTRAEVAARYPDAVSMEIFTPETEQPASAMTTDEHRAVLAWLDQIEEHSPEIVADVLELCQKDAEARQYFLARAAGLVLVN